MPRTVRHFLPQVPLHIVQRGADQQRCFWQEADFLRCLQLLRDVAQCGRVHAYVLMSNHVHLLVSFDDCSTMATMMKALDQRYCQYVNWRYRRSGSLWQGRYKSCLVQDERYLLVCQRYIELNPVRAGMVAYPGQYRWSSYRANAEGKTDELVQPRELYQRLGPDPASRQRAYRDLFTGDLKQQDIDRIRTATSANFAVGDQNFLRRVVESNRLSGD